MKMRLSFNGGADQHDRMVDNKLKSLKKALRYSYQRATLVTEEGKEFLCLINTDKEKGDYDNKILSIPFEDICINAPKQGKTTGGIVETEIQCGDVFKWKENDTHWIIYLRDYDEKAYFKSEIRRCDQQVEIGDKTYWAYVRGPVETTIPWNQKSGVEWNDINYSLVMYVTRDENTATHLHRFDKVKVAEPVTGELKTWEIINANAYYGDGIIEVYLDEYYENTIAEAAEEEKEAIAKQEAQNQTQSAKRIVGEKAATAFSKQKYSVVGISGGTWYIVEGDKKTSYGTGLTLTIDIVKKKGKFTVLYETATDSISMEVTIVSI